MNLHTLTERERTVLARLCEGLTPAEIAGVEYVSLATVRTHIRGIFMKLRVRSLHAAVAKAYQKGGVLEETRA